MVLPKDKLQKLCGATIIITVAFFSATSAQATELDNGFQKCWKELNEDRQFSISESFCFYRLKTDNGSLAALIVLDLNDHTFAIKPFFNKTTNTVSKIVKEQRAIAGINSGFFNLSNGESISYIVIDGVNQCDPKTNKALIENPELAPYLETIFNRSEFRILENGNGKLQASIVSHKETIPEGWKLLHSIQAGPKLLPQVADAEEAFVRKSANGKILDSICSRKPSARTAIGITKDNHVLLLSVADKKQDGFSTGATLEDLPSMLKALGCNQALNFDGGTSTTMVIAQGDNRDETDYFIHKVISGEPEKLVKSMLLIEKNKNRIKSRYSGNTLPY